MPGGRLGRQATPCAAAGAPLGVARAGLHCRACRACGPAALQPVSKESVLWLPATTWAHVARFRVQALGPAGKPAQSAAQCSRQTRRQSAAITTSQCSPGASACGAPRRRRGGGAGGHDRHAAAGHHAEEQRPHHRPGRLHRPRVAHPDERGRAAAQAGCALCPRAPRTSADAGSADQAACSCRTCAGRSRSGCESRVRRRQRQGVRAVRSAGLDQACHTDSACQNYHSFMTFSHTTGARHTTGVRRLH